MTLRSHVYRSVQQVEFLTDSFWIGDRPLQEAFRSFMHRKACRRNVSSTPGPLEARKRASKRRMVNIAPATGGTSIDPSLLARLGDQSQTGNWKWMPLEEPYEKPNRSIKLPRIL